MRELSETLLEVTRRVSAVADGLEGEERVRVGRRAPEELRAVCAALTGAARSAALIESRLGAALDRVFNRERLLLSRLIEQHKQLSLPAAPPLEVAALPPTPRSPRPGLRGRGEGT